MLPASLNSPATFTNGAYTIQGLNLADLCEKFGTPFYLYDLDYCVGRYRFLHDLFDLPNVRLHYAVKANNNPHLLLALKESGACLDVVSPSEVALALALGFDPSRLLYTANNMTDAEIRLIRDQGLLLNIDSLTGLRRYAKLYPNTELCLRFNSDVVAGEHEKVMTGGDKTKFGIRLEKVDEVLDIVHASGLKIVGVHEHTGSGITDPNQFIQGMKNLLTIVTPARFPDLRFIDFGGGFKVPYRPDEKRIDYVAFGQKVSAMLRAFFADFGRELALYFEPGKFIVAEGGLLMVQVNSLIENKTRLIAGTDSGFGHLVRPVLYNAYHHILNVSNPKGAAKTYDICGNICETGDLFAEDRGMPEIREGDYLALLNAGAYGYSMASDYNLRPKPAEVVVQNGKAFLSRKPHTPQEIVSNVLLQSGLK
ncbi:MAG: diaminopimelate decarboxylase [Proteobacteria bacterium]|jgi:diaminopimelate decarboxylase|nr:diaminopimelate decarboxylase [Alphaproteobacteria bacterium]NCC04211.1 diaminopimelate decarboxylase [Pseudomonadota bacterium]